MPAVRTSGWIADVTYERFAGQRPGETLQTETIHHMESDYAGTRLPVPGRVHSLERFPLVLNFCFVMAGIPLFVMA